MANTGEFSAAYAGEQLRRSRHPLRRFLESRRLIDCEGYSVTMSSYFPINLESIGNNFTFHELKVVYDQTK